MLTDREWRKTEGASFEAIERLKAIAPLRLPQSYLSLLWSSDGGEGLLPVQPYWLCLYPAREATQVEEEASFQKFFPGLFVIGGNGGGEAIALDYRGAEPYPVVAFDMCNCDLSESIMVIAPSFDDVLEFIGRDTL